MQLPREVRSRINRLARFLAQRHEAQIRASLTVDLQRMAANGAGLVELLEAMNRHDDQEGLGAHAVEAGTAGAGEHDRSL